MPFGVAAQANAISPFQFHADALHLYASTHLAIADTLGPEFNRSLQGSRNENTYKYFLYPKTVQLKYKIS